VCSRLLFHTLLESLARRRDSFGFSKRDPVKMPLGITRGAPSLAMKPRRKASETAAKIASFGF
jgi:hypothetical protein